MSAYRIFLGLILITIPVLCNGYHPDFRNSNIVDEYSDPDIIKADSLFSMMEREEALELYKKVEKRLGQSDDIAGYVHVLNRIGFIMIVKAGYDRTVAKKKLDKALEIGLNLLDIDSIRLAETYYCLGIFYDYLYDPDKAEYYHFLSLEIRKLFPTRKLELAQSYMAIGYLYHRKKNLLLSEKYYTESRNMYEEEFDANDHRLFFIYYKLYGLYREKYYFNEADLYARKCIEICENTSLRDTYLAFAYGSLANNYNDTEDYANAIPYYNLAIQNLIKLNGGTNSYLKIYYQNLSYAYLKQDSIELAAKYLIKTQQMYDLDSNPDLRNLAKLNMKWALYYMKSNDLDSALMNLEKCVSLNNQISEDEKEWDGLFFETLWEYYYTQGKYDTALSILQKSFYDYVDGFDNPDIYSNPVGHNIEEMETRVYDVIFKKARTFRNKYIYKSRQLNDLKTALELYHIANKLADDFRNSRMGESAVLFLNDYFRYDFELGIDCAYRLYKHTADPKYLEDAFEFMERGKYMLLLESIRNAEKLTEADIPEDLRKRKLEVEAEIANTNRLKDQELDKEEPDTVQVNRWNTELLELSKKIDDVRKELDENYQGQLEIDYENNL